MTPQEINEAVAKKLGWHEKELDLSSPWNPTAGKHKVLFNPETGNGGMIPNYSTDISAAWEVVELTIAKGWHWSIGDNDQETWFVEVEGNGGMKNVEVADTAPMAICLAFLKLGNQ